MYSDLALVLAWFMGTIILAAGISCFVEKR
jgi:hypothetical protein